MNLARTTAAEFDGRSIWLCWELRYGRVTLASLKVTFQSLLGMKQSNTTLVVKHISVWREKLRLLTKYKITLDALATDFP